MSIHSTAIVHPNAELADDVEVQPYTIIGEHVTIGPGTIVGPHCVIEGRTRIGAKNHIFASANIGVVSQDLKHAPGLVGNVTIGDGNMIREYVTISASTMESEEDANRVTSIGDGCLLMACSHVAHDCHVGNGVIMANCVLLAGHVDVESNVTIGGLCGVHQGCRVGQYAFVGGMTRAAKDIPPFMITEGVSPKCHGPNAIGLQRAGFDDEARARIKKLYRILYRSGMNVSQALTKIEEAHGDCRYAQQLVSFVRASKRGIVN